jgi:hypothetical protein
MLGLYALNCLSALPFGHFPSLPYQMLNGLVVVAPTAGYVDTLRLMVVGQTAGPYNINIAMILNSGQLLKILYFFYHRYALSLLGQCVGLLTVSATLTFLRFRYAIDDTAADFPHLKQRKRLKCPDFSNLGRLLNIWKAETFLEFHVTLFIYSILGYVIFLICRLVLGEKIAAEGTGLIANLIETTVSLPLFVKIVIWRQIEHVSEVLILQYFSGDLMKLVIFVLTRSPWPFFVGGFCQVGMDTLLFVTYLRLRFAPSPAVKKETPPEELGIGLEAEEELPAPPPEEVVVLNESQGIR